VERVYQGHVAYLDPNLKQGIKVLSTGLGLESVEVFKWVLFSYSFTFPINNFITYDLDYALFVFEESVLSFIVTKGFPGESYSDSDLKGNFETDSVVGKMIGYSATENGVYNYLFSTIEIQSNQQFLRNY